MRRNDRKFTTLFRASHWVPGGLDIESRKGGRGKKIFPEAIETAWNPVFLYVFLTMENTARKWNESEWKLSMKIIKMYKISASSKHKIGNLK